MIGRKHRNDPDQPTLDAGENYARAFRATASNWLIWLALLYMPLGSYIAFVLQPFGQLFGFAKSELLLVEMVAWIGIPLVLMIFLYYRMTATDVTSQDKPEN